MIFKLMRLLFLPIVLTTITVSVLPTIAQTTSQVRFSRGSDSARLSGTITGREYIDYVLRARGGQTMSVKLTVNGTNGNGSAYFNILPPGSTGEAIFNASTSPERSGSVRLPRDGEYKIRVYLMGNDRDTDKTVGYTVSVRIPPNNSTGSHSVSEAESNCLAAVANQTGVGDVSTIRVERAESGIGVLVEVPGAQAPWQCVVDTDGKTVVNVYYTGSEGAL